MPQNGLLPYRANSIINELSGYSGQVYAALATSASTPTVSGDSVTGITEVSTSGTGYKRIKLDSSLVTAASSGKSYNKEIIKFDEVLSSWGTIRYLVLYSSLTGGQPLAIAKLASDVTPSVHDMPIFRAGSDFSTANFKLSISMYNGNE